MNKLIGQSTLKTFDMKTICSGILEIEMGGYRQPAAFLTIKEHDLNDIKLTLAEKYFLTFNFENRGKTHLRAKLMGFNEGVEKNTLKLFFIKE